MSSRRYQAATPQGARVSVPEPSLRTSSLQREQELCLDALESGAYDSMSDKQWIELCERTAREEKERAEAAAELAGDADRL